jgi:hypothetical protein
MKKKETNFFFFNINLRGKCMGDHTKEQGEIE